MENVNMGLSFTGALTPTGRTSTRANKAPTWSSTGNLGQTLGGKPFTANLLGNDPEGTTVKYGIYDGGVLPSGISLNTETGVLSGTPVNNPGVKTFPIYITDGVDVIPQTFTLEIQNASPVWATLAGSLGTINEQASYSYSLAATDQNLDTLTFTVISGTLPTGLALGSNGTITGTTESVNQNTTSNFTVRLSDGVTGVSDRAFSLTINNSINQPPVWGTVAGSIATINEQTTYSYSLAASDVDVGDNLTYSISTGSLPGGLTLASNGTISGTTSVVYANTTSSFIVGVSDGHNAVIYRSFSMTVNNNINEPPVWTTAAGSLGGFNTDTSINITLVATDQNSDTITYATTSGALPTGLTLSSAGALTGSTSQTGTFNFTVTATDTNSGTTARAFTITTTPAVATYRYLRLAMSVLNGDGYIQVEDLRFTTAAGTQYPNPAVNMTTNTTPSPLVASASSVLSTFEPFFAFTTQFDGSSSRWHSTAAANPWIQIDLGAGNGIAPVSVQIALYTTVSRSINTFVIQGSNTGAFTGEQVNIGGASGLAHASWTIDVARSFPIGPQAPVWVTPSGSIGSYNAGAYSFPFLASNANNAAVTYAVQSGSLPTGITLNTSTGVISGTSSSTASASFTIRATSENLNTDRAFTMTWASIPVCRYYRLVTTALNGDTYLEIQNFRLVAGGITYPNPAINMTSNTAPSPLVASASSTHAGLEPFYAFSDVGGSVSRWHSTAGNAQWLQIDLGSSISATSAVIACNTATSRSINTFTIQGSATGTFTGEQTVVYTGTGLTAGSWTNNVDRTFTF
jgi:hypothetical protein